MKRELKEEPLDEVIRGGWVEDHLIDGLSRLNSSIFKRARDRLLKREPGGESMAGLWESHPSWINTQAAFTARRLSMMKKFKQTASPSLFFSHKTPLLLCKCCYYYITPART